MIALTLSGKTQFTDSFTHTPPFNMSVINATTPVPIQSIPVSSTSTSSSPTQTAAECGICVEKFSSFKRKPIRCHSCNFPVCRSCVSMYLLNLNGLAKCCNPECSKEWSRRWLVEQMGHGFVSGAWRERRKQVWMEKLQAILPDISARFADRRDLIDQECKQSQEELDRLVPMEKTARENHVASSDNADTLISDVRLAIKHTLLNETSTSADVDQIESENQHRISTLSDTVTVALINSRVLGDIRRSIHIHETRISAYDLEKKYIRRWQWNEWTELLKGDKHEKKARKRHMVMKCPVEECFGTDSRVMTSHGFLFLDEVQAAIDRGVEIKYAAYAKDTEQLTYVPGRLIVNPADPNGTLISFTDANERARLDQRSSATEAGPSNHTSIRVTGGHNMFIQGDVIARATEVLENNQPVRFMNSARGGVSPTTWPTFTLAEVLREALGLKNCRCIDAFLELYGFWLGAGSMSLDIADEPRLRAQLSLCGLSDTEWRAHRTADGTEVLSIINKDWLKLFDLEYGAEELAWWVLQLCTPAQCRLILAGMQRIDGASSKSIYASSVTFRDQIVLLALHAGYSAHFHCHQEKVATQQGSRTIWCVQFAHEESSTIVNADGEGIKVEPYTDVTWCIAVDHPDHLIVAQRAVRNDEGTVVKATKAVIIGNCRGFVSNYWSCDMCKQKVCKHCREPIMFTLTAAGIKAEQKRLAQLEGKAEEVVVVVGDGEQKEVMVVGDGEQKRLAQPEGKAEVVVVVGDGEEKEVGDGEEKEVVVVGDGEEKEVGDGEQKEIAANEEKEPMDNENRALNSSRKQAKVDPKLLGHVCNKDTLETVKLLVSDSHPCPTCTTMITKIEGCDQMWCTQCQTAFSWKTGEVEKGRVHNPHYYEYKRQQSATGEIPREAGDNPCGRGLMDFYDAFNEAAVSQYLSYEILRTMERIHLYVMDLYHDKLTRERHVLTSYGHNHDLGMAYLMRDKSEAEVRAELTLRERHLDLSQSLIDIIEMAWATLGDVTRSAPTYLIKRPSAQFSPAANSPQRAECEAWVRQIYNLMVYVTDEMKQVMSDHKRKGTHLLFRYLPQFAEQIEALPYHQWQLRREEREGRSVKGGV